MIDPERPGAEDPRDEDAGAPADSTADAAARPRRGDRRSRSRSGSFLRELPVLLLVAFVLAFLLRTFVVQVFYIPSSSMEPTLQINDRMVVEKISYRFREPRRGEIAVFEGDELQPGTADDNGAQRFVRGLGQFIGIVPASARDFVKRVVGLPGDEVVIEDGQVFVNGEALYEPYVHYDDEADFGPVTVPEDRLFFLGDNRPNSSDSRRSLGFVPMDHLVGRASVVIWPLDHAGMLTGTAHQVPDPETGAPEPDGTQAPEGEAEPDPPDDEGASAPQRELQPAF